MDGLFSTPILFIIFNRPDTTMQVFEEIRKVKPRRLFVAADGPRSDKHDEAGKCQATRDIIKQVDWECKVETLFRDKNLGCKMGVSSAIDWFFKNVDEGIILEDDCVPELSFFRFCEAMLERYRNDRRIMHISGDNFQFGKWRGEGSYYFSHYPHIWGWATWRRAWQLYDVSMSQFPKFKDLNQIKNVFSRPEVQHYWIKVLQHVYNNKVDTWDHQWSFTLWSHGGLSILPNNNLISNIGFRADGTHTKEVSSVANMFTKPLTDFCSPTHISADIEADDYTFEKIYRTRFLKKVMNKLRFLIKS